MKLYDLLKRDSKIFRLRLLMFAAISGLANAAVLAIINISARNVTDQEANLRNMILFILAIVIFVITQKHMMVDVCRQVEQLIDRLRVRLIERARQTEFLEIEEIGRSEIYACLSRETQVISQAAPTMAIATQSAILVFFTMLYMAILSMTAFVLSAVFTAIGAAWHLSRSKEVRRQLQETYHRENDLVEGITDMLDGFKEVKMNTLRGEEISSRVKRVSGDVAALKTETQTANSHDFVMSQVTFFLLTGLMVFIVPSISEAYVEVVIMTTTASLFMIGPVSNVVGYLPTFANANAAAESILGLEERLTGISGGEDEVDIDFGDFRQLTLRGLCFHHKSPNGEAGFTVGPVDLKVNRGETIFITGGNGSGKTTFLRLLIGLYPASQGALLVDRTAINRSNIAAYRNLFSVIFSDNHLFAELYGIREVDTVMADGLFELLEMRHKARLEGRRFNNIKLSGGQRKRLALIASVLEKRPICMFDEWAADQDPHFREKFYRVILPRLKESGITVLAITHDDKYFDTADRHLHLEDGQVEEIPIQGA
ncbi:cyclic peptide export ABC transporter [Endothiovibrio diazotrophicus]